MNRLLYVIITFVLCIFSNIRLYADNTIVISDISVENGETTVDLPLLMTNESDITGFQCDLSLPEGVTIALDEYGDYRIALSRTSSNRHSISTLKQSDGSVRILCTSMTNAVFSGKEGAVLNITLSVSGSLSSGTYEMQLKNIVLSDTKATRYTSPESVAMLEIKGYEKQNVLTIEDVALESGTTVDLPLLMTNESDITGFQCDLSLPEGVTIALDEYGDYRIALSRTSSNRHSISTLKQSDGSVRILCTSMTNAVFSGKEGAVLNITLSVSGSLSSGTYEMQLKNIVLSDTKATRYTSPDVSSRLIKKETSGMTVNIYDGDELVDVYSLGGVLVKKGVVWRNVKSVLSKGVYIVKGVKVLLM